MGGPAARFHLRDDFGRFFGCHLDRQQKRIEIALNVAQLVAQHRKLGVTQLPFGVLRFLQPLDPRLKLLDQSHRHLVGLVPAAFPIIEDRAHARANPAAAQCRPA